MWHVAGMLQKKGAAKLRRELLVGFDPVSMLVDKLRQRYHGTASFFVDVFGGHAIGVKWSSKAVAVTPFDAKKAHVLEPINGLHPGHAVQTCALSISAVLSDIKAVGAGLVQHVSLLNQ